MSSSTSCGRELGYLRSAGPIFRLTPQTETLSIRPIIGIFMLMLLATCIRMTNEDVVDLYDRVRVGTPVMVQR